LFPPLSHLPLGLRSPLRRADQRRSRIGVPRVGRNSTVWSGITPPRRQGCHEVFYYRGYRRARTMTDEPNAPLARWNIPKNHCGSARYDHSGGRPTQRQRRSLEAMRDPVSGGLLHEDRSGNLVLPCHHLCAVSDANPTGETTVRVVLSVSRAGTVRDQTGGISAFASLCAAPRIRGQRLSRVPGIGQAGAPGTPGHGASQRHDSDSDAESAPEDRRRSDLLKHRFEGTVLGAASMRSMQVRRRRLSPASGEAPFGSVTSPPLPCAPIAGTEIISGLLT